MSNLYSYFQRIEPKKLDITTTVDESSHQRSNLSKDNTSAFARGNQTPKTSSMSSRKTMNMQDIYSTDSPKSGKRKPASTVALHDNDALPKNKSKIILKISK